MSGKNFSYYFFSTFTNFYNSKKGAKKGIFPVIPLFLFLSFSFLFSSHFTGMPVAKDFADSCNQTLNLTIKTNKTFPLELPRGALESFRVSGFFSGSGSAKIYLFASNQTFLVFDTNAISLSEPTELAGFVVFSNQSKNNVAKQNHTSETTEAEKLYNTTSPKTPDFNQTPSLNLLLLPPSPENHSVLQEPNLTLNLTSNLNLSSCSLLFNQTRIKMNLSNNLCSL
ncbi:MAG: hypothetical protein DRP16_00585, partial [Candidatus Aenigmatarchaeota archaeon]